MKAETQAVLLEKMMKNKKVHSAYELILPLFTVKSTDLKDLSIKDILLVGLDRMEISVLYNGQCAKVKMTHTNDTLMLEIDSIGVCPSKSIENVKSEVVKCLFANITFDTFTLGEQCTIDKLVLDTFEIFIHDDVKIAEGKLVEVMDKIAIEITRVMNV
ncbi:MAG: hypothetical protein L3J43_06585 [Sulfurovum sp.]|nr:hypothetical protein [Sulfurovum sp.]